MSSEDWDSIIDEHKRLSGELDAKLKKQIEDIRAQFKEERGCLTEETKARWKAQVDGLREQAGAALEAEEEALITIGYETTKQGTTLHCPISEKSYNTELVKAACIEALLHTGCKKIIDKNGCLSVPDRVASEELDDILRDIFMREEHFAGMGCLYKEVVAVVPDLDETKILPKTTKMVTSDEIYDTIKVPKKEPEGLWCIHRAVAYLARLAQDEFVQERPLSHILNIPGLKEAVLRFWKNIQYLIPRPDEDGYYTAHIEDIEDFRDRQMTFGTNREYEFFDSPLVGNINVAIEEYQEIHEYSQVMDDRAAKSTATRLRRLLRPYGFQIDWLDEEQYPEKLLFTENSLNKARQKERGRR